MPTASIVYWYTKDAMRLDGGGLRVRAWEEALTAIGYDVKICGVWSIGGGVARGGRISRLKRTLIPMPFRRVMPSGSADADVVIATIPAVFGNALQAIPTSHLILDWMDLWSVAARNLGDAHWGSRIGGRAQERLWRRRESVWTGQGQANVYAGYDDFLSMSPLSSGPSSWVPTPVVYRGAAKRTGTRRLGFIGNLDYPPNEKSLRRFLTQYAHQVVRQGWEIVIAGFGSTKVAEWGQPVTVLGEISDVEAFYANIGAAVVPIEHGGGIKVKAVEALSFGVPVLTTEHVRSGFGEEFHPYLPDLSAIAEGLDAVEFSPVPREMFERHFAPEAFAQSVRQFLPTTSLR